ncbi:MAG: WYL domain-containing protein [Candidatus Gastranaerophilales bacterium]|nr:WYL domain-containing protein [Candidatus Gastranaerophilales bacterium]
MRYEKLELLFRLVLDMQNSYHGVSIQWIMDEYEVSRSTAIRMKDMIARLFPVEEIELPETRIKKWKLNKFNTANMIAFSSEEIAELERSRSVMKNYNITNSTDLIGLIITKINSINKQKAMKTDVEAMLEAEGYARRQFPKRKISLETLEVVSECLKAYKCMEFEYTNKKGETRNVKVQPYAIIYGENTLLLAYNEYSKGFRHYYFHMIKNPKVSEDYFDKDETFNLEEYLSRSFGVFQEEPMDIELLFSKEVAEAVLEYNLHSTQQMTQNPDGTVTVKMKTGGRNEICWHLFKWGKNVKIIAPQELIDNYKKLLDDAIGTI